ncbi:glycosyltransferase family 2 protein [Leifsonia shinshuensis]|uniref:glycosyltransferase family 2 protein n=1 Tax=Leifsonia shinshuensis TaxID=150026 RepID=UPI002856A1E4|nr:glycosyltransferase family 2 protein [Leifsonia shinshuensis]MDR6973260.1 glycosyltransferase involved in cell wall biosynthesis [Leifsonia shinshuensis]
MTIDIMMPFYGDPEQLRAAVNSVLAQTDPEWRLVVIDDQYPDRAPGEWVQGLGDPRVQYLLNETNLGVSGNFSRSLELVESEHFVLMGCDDVLEPGYIAQMRAAVQRFPGTSYYQPQVSVISDRGEPFLPLADRVKRWSRPRKSHPVILQGESLAVSLLRGNWTYFPSICWRTDAVRAAHGFDPRYEIVLDLALQLTIITGGGTMALLPERTFQYRRHEASVSSATARYGGRFDEERRFFHDVAAQLDAMGWRRAARAARRHVTSRLNAATKLPGAIRGGDRDGRSSLLRHVFTNRAVR